MSRAPKGFKRRGVDLAEESCQECGNHCAELGRCISCGYVYCDECAAKHTEEAA